MLALQKEDRIKNSPAIAWLFLGFIYHYNAILFYHLNIHISFVVFALSNSPSVILNFTIPLLLLWIIS